MLKIKKFYIICYMIEINYSEKNDVFFKILVRAMKKVLLSKHYVLIVIILLIENTWIIKNLIISISLQSICKTLYWSTCVCVVCLQTCWGWSSSISATTTAAPRTTPASCEMTLGLVWWLDLMLWAVRSSLRVLYFLYFYVQWLQMLPLKGSYAFVNNAWKVEKYTSPFTITGIYCNTMIN